MSSVARARTGPFTWDDFVALDEDDLRELIDGELVEVEVPTLVHERAVAEIASTLRSFARRRGGMALASGYKIRISEARGVMPDAQLYLAGNEPAPDQNEGFVRGRPDLVVEVVSPSSRRHDRIVKLGYYAALKVPEYWTVDPEARTVERLVFSKKGYVIASIHENEGVFAPPRFPGLRLRIEQLWAARLPSRAARGGEGASPAEIRSTPVVSGYADFLSSSCLESNNEPLAGHASAVGSCVDVEGARQHHRRLHG
jgi:Uma2 family endonuclease